MRSRRMANQPHWIPNIIKAIAEALWVNNPDAYPGKTVTETERKP